jgi:uncharacterized membrane protein YecN with MAPEG domain
MPVITTLYAGLLGLILIGVAFPAGFQRGRKNIPVGDGGDPAMLLAMRRHANFAEWVPFTLLLIALLELDHVRGTAIHALGAGLVLARICHALGLKADTMKNPLRFIGAILQVLVTAVAAVWAITIAL